MNRVIGVVGPLASGKGVVLHQLQQQGYAILSLSDTVREKAKEWGLALTRENLQDVGDKLRQKFGKAILAEMLAPVIHKSPSGKFVIDGLRNPSEVAFFKKEFNAYIIGVTAKPEKRFELMQQRNREYDPKTWKEFLKAEQRDRGVGQEDFGQQVEKSLQLADIVVENNGTLEEFEEKIRKLFQIEFR